jgi:hypothetical protein
MVTRKQPTNLELLCAAILKLADIPHEVAKTMTRGQIRALMHGDHDPVPWSVARDLGWTPEQYNHPSNLTMRLVDGHKEKTARRDIPQIAKNKRVTKEQAAFQARLLAPGGQDAPAPVKTKPKVKIKSRGFQKPPEGHKHKWGHR